MSCNGMAILFREADCHTRPTVSCGLNRDSAALVPFTLMLYVSAPLSKHLLLTVDLCSSRGWNTPCILWPSRCCFVLSLCLFSVQPIDRPFKGVSNALGILWFCTCFLADIALYSTSHFKLSWFFILSPFCHCTLAFRWLLFVQVLLSTAILFRSSDNNAWRLKKKLPSLL